MGDSDNLDQLAIDILGVLEASDGEATTSDLKEMLGEDHTSRINHRKTEYLEPAGYVEIEQPLGEPGPAPPAEWTLTEDGRERLNSEDNIDHEFDIKGELEAIKSQLDRLEARLDRMDEKTGEALVRTAAHQMMLEEYRGQFEQIVTYGRPEPKAVLEWHRNNEIQAVDSEQNAIEENPS